MDVVETTHKLQEITRASAVLLETADWAPTKITTTPDGLSITVTFTDGTAIEYRVERMAHDWQIIHTNSENTVQSEYRTNNNERIVRNWARTLIREIG